MNDQIQPNLPPDELTQHFWQAWREQLAKTPRLAHLLLQRGRQLLERFQHFHHALELLSRPAQLRWQRKVGASLAGVALALALSSAPAQAAAITVDSTTCTLVDAITAANTDTATGGCAAGSGPDMITLLSDVTLYTANNGNAYSANGLPVISSVITIEGAGHTIARDAGAPQFRILQVDAGGDLTLSSTTISGGDSNFGFGFNLGGGILNYGALTLNNSTISGNIARLGGGGISNDGTLTLNSSTVSGNSTNADGTGGGIFTFFDSTTNLNNSTVSGNSAYGGGGITNNGTLTLSNSTVSGNSASAWGGGILSQFNTLTLSNSTVSAGARGGGGIYNLYGTLTLERSLISGNSALNGQEILNYAGTINSNNLNLFGHSGESNAQAFSNFTPGGSDINATSDGANVALTSILNTTLQVNAPGSTATHALVAGSPAVDAAPTGPTTDQRGVSRPQGCAFDIGAFELVWSPICNTVPVATNDSYSTNEDTPLSAGGHPSAGSHPGVLNNDSDAESNLLTAALVAAPLHGTLTLNANGSFIYTPNANFSGTDSFTYKANDGQADSNVATVNLIVNGVNDAPFAMDDSYSTNEDTPLTIPAPGVRGNDSDVEGNALTAVLVSGPAHGSVTLNADGSFTYTPAANFSGTDSFTYKANDGGAPPGPDSTVATVNLTVVSVASQIAQLKAQVQALITSGALPSSNGGALINKLDSAEKQLQKGNTSAAITKLQEFITQVNNYITNGILTAAQGQPLIDAANATISSINGGAGAASVDAQSNRLFLPLVER